MKKIFSKIEFIVNTFVFVVFSMISFSSIAAPVTSAEATVLSFPSGSTNQNSVISMTSDSRTITTGFTNSTYNATDGMVIEVSPGTYSFGFGSYVPESYTGPGYMYLHRVVIKDQAGATLLNESFDGWSQVGTTSTTGSITRSQFSTTAGATWSTYGDGASYLSPPFATNTSAGDIGISYPMDGSGPFSVLIKTLVTAPAGTTHLKVNVEWRYNVSIFSGANRLFSIGVRQGDVPTENLFSFSAPANSAPSATSVSISGTAQVASNLTGTYTFTDADSDAEGASTFRWVRNNVSTGVAGGTDVATATTYSPVSADVGSNLYFCVLPVAAAGTTSGTEVCSEATSVVAAAPAPAAIPTLSEWAMLCLASLMAMFAYARMRRQS